MSGLMSSVLRMVSPISKSPMQEVAENLPLLVNQTRSEPENGLQDTVEASQRAFNELTTQQPTSKETQPLQKRKVSWLQKGIGLAMSVPKGLEFGPLLAHYVKPHLTVQNGLALVGAYAIYKWARSSMKSSNRAGGVTNNITLHLTIPQALATPTKTENSAPQQPVALTVTHTMPIKV